MIDVYHLLSGLFPCYLCHFDHTYICAVKVLRFSHFIGIDAGVYTWQIACYDLGFWICFAESLLMPITTVFFA